MQVIGVFKLVFLNKALKSDLACLEDELHLWLQKRPHLVLVLKYCQCRADFED